MIIDRGSGTLSWASAVSTTVNSQKHSRTCCSARPVGSGFPVTFHFGEENQITVYKTRLNNSKVGLSARISVSLNVICFCVSLHGICSPKMELPSKTITTNNKDLMSNSSRLNAEYTAYDVFSHARWRHRCRPAEQWRPSVDSPRRSGPPLRGPWLRAARRSAVPVRRFWTPR